MKDDPQRESPARAKTADTMAHADTIDSALPSYRALIDGEDYPLPLTERYNFDARLHPRALFGQDEFAPLEILLGQAEQNCQL